MRAKDRLLPYSLPDPPTPSEPRTDAGRAMVAGFRERPPAGINLDVFEAAIARIEREAVALAHDPTEAREMSTEPPAIIAATHALLAELAESPLDGARYARDVVLRRLPAIEAEIRADASRRPDPQPDSQPSTAECRCRVDSELGAGSTCPACGHRDHGKSGCYAPVRPDSQPPTSEPLAEAMALLDDFETVIARYIVDAGWVRREDEARRGASNIIAALLAITPPQEAADRTQPPTSEPSVASEVLDPKWWSELPGTTGYYHQVRTSEDLARLRRAASQEAADRTPDVELRQRAAFLADRAAHAVTEPRRFHESADEQHDLSVAIADVRAALGTTPEPLDGWELCSDPESCVDMHWHSVPPMTTSDPRPDVEQCPERCLGIVGHNGPHQTSDYESADRVRQMALDAFDATMKHVEPWASGPVLAKHRARFAAALRSRR